MDWYNQLLGKADDLSTTDYALRALLVFAGSLIILRIAGKRTFGKTSAFDQVVIVMLGGILGRAVVGVSPFFPVMGATLATVLFHRLIGWCCLYSKGFGKLVKGSDRLLYAHGQVDKKACRKALISEDDLKEGIRLTANKEDAGSLKKIYLERSGQISVVEQ